MAHQKILMHFDSRSDAQAAMDALVQAGIGRHAIRMLPEEDRYAYAEGMSRGGVTLAVTAEEGQIDRVSEIAERHGAVDMDEREASWRREGWTGYTGGMTGSAGARNAATAAQG